MAIIAITTSSSIRGKNFFLFSLEILLVIGLFKLRLTISLSFLRIVNLFTDFPVNYFRINRDTVGSLDGYIQ